MKTRPSDAPALQFLQHNQEGLTLPVHQALPYPVSEDGRPTFAPRHSCPRILLTGQTTLLVRRWVLPDNAVVRSCKQWFLPGVRIATAFACKITLLIQRQIGEDT